MNKSLQVLKSVLEVTSTTLATVASAQEAVQKAFSKVSEAQEQGRDITDEELDEIALETQKAVSDARTVLENLLTD